MRALTYKQAGPALITSSITAGRWRRRSRNSASTERLSPINAANVQHAYALIRSAAARGKVVLDGDG